MWFSSRLQPWLQRRRNWRGWAPQKKKRQNLAADFPPPWAGTHLRTAFSHPTPYSGLCLKRMYSVLTKEDFRLAGAFSSDTSLLLALLESLHLWLRRQCWPLLWEGSCISQNLRGCQGPVLFSDQVIPASERLSDGLHRILVGAEEWASALERFLLKEIALVEEGGGGRGQGGD